jgi:hypothetical protein
MQNRNQEDGNLNNLSLLALQPCVGLGLLHPPIPRFVRSFSTLSSHLRLGFPAAPVPSGLEEVSYLHRDVPFALVRCLSHLSLHYFMSRIAQNCT